MKKTLSWKVLLGVAAASFIISKIVGGVVGDAINLLFIITLLLGIVAIFQQRKTQK